MIQSCVSLRNQIHRKVKSKSSTNYLKITEFPFSELQKTQDEFFAQINDGEFLKVLENSEFKSFLDTGKEAFNKDQKLGLAAACLLVFIQDNFTGPDLESGESFRFKTIEDDQNKWNVDRISIDGIEINANIRNITLLIISRNFLEDLAEQFPSDLVNLHLLNQSIVFINQFYFSSSTFGSFE